MNNILKSVAYTVMPSNLRGTKEAIIRIDEWLENPAEVSFNNGNNSDIDTEINNFLFVMWHVKKEITNEDASAVKMKSVINNLYSISEYLSNISFEWFALIFANGILLFIKFPFLGYSPLIRKLFEFNNSFVFVIQLIFDVSSMVTVNDHNKALSFAKRLKFTKDMPSFIRSQEYFYTTTFGNPLIQRKSIILPEERNNNGLELIKNSLGVEHSIANEILDTVSKYEVSIWVKRLLQYIYSNNSEKYIKSIKI